MTVTRREVVAADGTHIPVWLSGQGRPLLMVHGAIANHEAWEPVRPHLERSGEVQVATMDRRTNLEDPFQPLDLETEFLDIATVAQELGDEVDLFGHSSGALCAMGAALRMSNLRRLILYEPPMVAGVEPGPEQIAAFQALNENLQAGNDEGLLDVFLRDFAGPGLTDLETWHDFRDQMLPFVRSLPREMAAVGQCTQLAPEAIAPLNAPTLFLKGGITRWDSFHVGYIEPVRSVVPRLTVRELPHQEHLANFTAPEMVADVVLEFLQAEVPASR